MGRTLMEVLKAEHEQAVAEHKRIHEENQKRIRSDQRNGLKLRIAQAKGDLALLEHIDKHLDGRSDEIAWPLQEFLRRESSDHFDEVVVTYDRIAGLRSRIKRLESELKELK